MRSRNQNIKALNPPGDGYIGPRAKTIPGGENTTTVEPKSRGID